MVSHELPSSGRQKLGSFWFVRMVVRHEGLKDIPSGRNQLLVGFSIGHCQEEQIFHTKCKLQLVTATAFLDPEHKTLRCFPRLCSGF